MIPWMDEVLAQQGLSELVLNALDVESLLAMRLVERRGPGLVAAVFDLADAKRRLRRFDDDELARRLCCKHLVARGELWMLQYARTGPRPFPWSVHTAAEAAKRGHVHVLYWMYFEASPPVAPPYQPSDVFKTANGNRVVHSDDSYRREHWGLETEAAAQAGRLDVIKWLRKHCFPLTQKACFLAAKGGHMHALKFMSVLADPQSDWLVSLLRHIHGVRGTIALQSEHGLVSEFRGEYRRALEVNGWLPILQWYYPFATATECRQMFEIAPREWLEGA